MNEFYDDDDEFLLHFLLSKIFSKIQVPNYFLRGFNKMTRASNTTVIHHPLLRATRSKSLPNA